MTRFRIQCLLFSCIWLSGCASDYKTLRSIPPASDCIEKLKPAGIAPSWYKTGIDVVGKRISGLLLVKVMPDSSQRVVFTNEAGVKFLDFEFGKDQSFKVHHIIDQLDRKPVIRLLQKDFELMLALPFRTEKWEAWQLGEDFLFGVTEKGEKRYFLTGRDCASLHRIEVGSKRKRMVSLQFFGGVQPDSIHLQHHTFAMQMTLKKLATD